MTESAISLTTPSAEETKTIAVLKSRCSSRKRRRIWAAMVTSRGWVMLSATRKVGLVTRASTIITRCIMPPLNWNGKSANRCRCEGMRTASRTSSTRAVASRSEIPGSTARSFSTIWRPTGNVGSSALPGSEPM